MCRHKIEWRRRIIKAEYRFGGLQAPGIFLIFLGVFWDIHWAVRVAQSESDKRFSPVNLCTV